MKKLYLVKREVVASNVVEAMKNKGTIYEIQLTEEKMWPENKNKVGFKIEPKYEEKS